MLYWMIFCFKTAKYCRYEGSESALCLSRSMVLRYLQSSSSLCRALKAEDQFLPGSVPHKEAAQALTIDGVGGRHHSDSLLICSTSMSSCLCASSCCVWCPLATERVLPRNRLLRGLLLTLNFLAASDMFPELEEFINAIASSIGAIVAEVSRVEGHC